MRSEHASRSHKKRGGQTIGLGRETQQTTGWVLSIDGIHSAVEVDINLSDCW